MSELGIQRDEALGRLSEARAAASATVAPAATAAAVDAVNTIEAEVNAFQAQADAAQARYQVSRQQVDFDSLEEFIVKRDAALVRLDAARVAATAPGLGPGATRKLTAAELTELDTTTVNALKAASPEKLSRFARLKAGGSKFVGGALPVLGQLLAQLVIDVDVRPTEFRIPASAKNVLMVYHIENPYFARRLPSAYRLCALNSAGQCGQKFYLANTCNSDTDACILAYSPPGKGDDSYSLLVAVNNQQMPQSEWFDSIMYPSTPPLKLQGSFKVASISPQDVVALSTKKDDAGHEKALKQTSTDEAAASDSQIVITGDSSG